MRVLMRPGLRILLVFACTTIAAEAAQAQSRKRVSEPVPVYLDVRVIHAFKEKGEIGPGCRDIVKRLPMPFGSVQLVQSQVFELALGQPTQFELPSGRAVRMLPVSIIDRQLHLLFEMAGIMNTRLRMRSGTPMIVGGERHRGGRLIVEVTPRFWNGPGGPPVRRPEPPVRSVRGRGPDAER